MANTGKPKRALVFFSAMLASAFVLNWIWEMAQANAYVAHPGMLRRCTLASFADAAITAAIYAVGALATKRLLWATTRTWNVYLTCAVLGFVYAVLVERHAIAAHRWVYSETMPVIPALQAGLWPVLQLTLLVPVSVWFGGASLACWVRGHDTYRRNTVSSERKF